MKNGTKLSIAAAALSGLMMGATARATPVHAPAANAKDQVKKSVDAGQKAVKFADDTADKHDCKGKNDCKGKGGCKTGDNGCKGKNSCKGKGGCKTNEDKKV